MNKKEKVSTARSIDKFAKIVIVICTSFLFISVFLYFINENTEKKLMSGEYFVKLYKKSGGELFFWESWNNKKTFTVHWGKVGETGNRKDVESSFMFDAKKEVLKEEKSKRLHGYKEFDKSTIVIIQYKVESFGTPQDLNKRYKIEEIMNERLGWTGLGHCDGGDIGSGTMNIFCLVVNATIANQVIQNALKEKRLIDGVIIAKKTGEEIQVLYPENFKEEFNY